MKAVVSYGEALIDFLSVDGRTYAAHPGGAPANVAAAAARLGAEAFFLGKVGKDAFGAAIRAKLDSCGVHTGYILETAEANTALAIVTLQPDGDRTFSFYRERTADLCMAPEDIPLELLDGAFVFHFGSLMLTGEPARAATMHAVRAARQRGCVISFDPNVRLGLWPSPDAARTRILEAMPLADIVKINDEELDFLMPDAQGSVMPLNEKAAAFRKRHRIPCLLTTLGPDGCLTVSDRGIERFPGSPAVRAIDTTGAGDALIGAVLAQIADHCENREQWMDWMRQDVSEWPAIVARAVAFASISTEKHGAIDSYPAMSEVNRRLS